MSRSKQKAVATWEGISSNLELVDNKFNKFKNENWAVERVGKEFQVLSQILNLVLDLSFQQSHTYRNLVDQSTLKISE